MGEQKSAEGIVVMSHGGEGPNMEDRMGADTSMDEGDADRMTEKSEDSRKAAGGTSRGPERERQASTAGQENTQPRAHMLMEEVLRRENLLKEPIPRL